MPDKQTAVKWLSERFLFKDNDDPTIEEALQMEREQLISFGAFASGLKREYNPSVGKHLWYGVISGKHSGMTDDELIEHYFKKVKK